MITRHFLALALALLTASSADALEFSKHANDSATTNAIAAKGTIVPEDAFRFQAYLSKLPDKPVTELYLESSGGSIQGGLALGRQVNKAGVRTFAIDGNGCVSSCVHVLVAGKDGANGKPYRVKGTATRIGLHHFTPRFDEKPNYTSKDMQNIEARAQKTALEITLFYEEVEADLQLLSYGLKQTDMYFLKNEEALPLGLHIYDAATKELVLADKFLARLKR